MKCPFIPADILLPKQVDSRWPVVACDQFTSQPEYWHEVEEIVGDAPSTLNMILPEVYLNSDPADRINKINENISGYLKAGVFDEFKDAMIYVERTLPDGKVRRGLVAALDLESYDFSPMTDKAVRATEGTVLSRIPPRVEIRKDAPMELPHVMLLTNDEERTVIEPLSERKGTMKKLYDVDLMLSGGHVTGYLLNDSDKEAVEKAILELYENSGGFLFAVGDGNHSLATAKTCYQQSPGELNRYALCELVNLYDEALEFEPIYRVVFGVDAENVIFELEKYLADVSAEAQRNSEKTSSCRFEYYYNGGSGAVEGLMGDKNPVAVGVLQDFLDEYVGRHPEAEVDYIHGEDVTKALAERENTVGFIFKGMEKSSLFDVVSVLGALPRKTFSMGEAASKRYYMECRRITTEG